MPRISITLPPITITKKTPHTPVPVSLTPVYVDGDDAYALGVLFDDDSTKFVSFDGDKYIPVSQEGMLSLMSPESCSQGSWHSEDMGNIPSAYVDDAFAGEFGMNSCSMNGDNLNCNLLLSLDESATFYLSLEDIEPGHSNTFQVGDFEVLE